MDFSFDISTLQWTLFELSLLAVAVAAVAFIARVLPLRRRMRASESVPEPESYENAAVIVYSNDEAADLDVMLPQVLAQDYPAGFEAIVVNEGDSPAVRETVSTLQITHRNLYLTATPDGARNLSRKKLAITLGIKATRQPVVVLTTAAARIPSDRWLRGIMRHFTPDGSVEVVLGYAAPDPYEDSSLGARTRSFDSVAEAAAWVSPAISRHPWRGIEHNIAYRRELFFNNKGFSRHLNLRHGDDDIFISEIARRDNTVVDLSPDTFVEVPGANSHRAFKLRSARRRFTERFIRRRPRFVGAIGFGAYFMAPLLALVGALLSPMNGFGWACTATVIVLWVMAGMLWRPAMNVLHGRRLFLTLPALAFTRPVRQTWRNVRGVLFHGKRYTWE